jgi:hypothetical protein
MSLLWVPTRNQLHEILKPLRNAEVPPVGEAPCFLAGGRK